MNQGPAYAANDTASAFEWSGHLPGWARDLEQVITALHAKQQKISDTNLEYLVRTALCLNEATAAIKMRGQLIDGETIMAISARASSQGSTVAWSALAIYRLARFLVATDPNESLSPDGIAGAIHRTKAHDAGASLGKHEQRRDRPRATDAAQARGTVIDACLELRRLWLKIPDLETTNQVAARLLVAPLFARTTGFQQVFMGHALGAREAASLRAAMTDESQWMVTLMPILARATHASNNRILQLIGVRERWLAKLATTRPRDERRNSNILDTLFVQPILSTVNMAKIHHQLTGIEPKIRTTQGWMAELQEAGAVESYVEDRQNHIHLWRVKEATLLGA